VCIQLVQEFLPRDHILVESGELGHLKASLLVVLLPLLIIDKGRNHDGHLRLVHESLLVLVLSVIVVLVVGGHLSVESLRWCGVMVLLVVRWRWLWSKGWVIVLGEAGMESWDTHLRRFQALIVI
jgi:hypothetical protein